MAGRKVIHGLKYFPLELGFFEDHKILLIEERHKVEGGYCALRLIAMIYEQGYFMQWLPFQEVSTAKRIGNGFTGEKVLEILNTCLEVDLFNKELFECQHILTSHGIQKRWLQVQILLRRKVDSSMEYWLLEDEKPTTREAPQPVITSEVIAIPSEDMTITSEEIPVPATLITQKKIKGKNKSIKKQLVPTVVSGAIAPPAKERSFKQWTSDEFVKEINKHAELFTYVLRNEFYKYWKEKSAGGLMRFQLERTWETKLRLDTWLRRENEKNKSNGTHKQTTTRSNKQTGANELLEDLRAEFGEPDTGRAANY